MEDDVAQCANPENHVRHDSQACPDNILDPDLRWHGIDGCELRTCILCAKTLMGMAALLRIDEDNLPYWQPAWSDGDKAAAWLRQLQAHPPRDAQHARMQLGMAMLNAGIPNDVIHHLVTGVLEQQAAEAADAMRDVSLLSGEERFQQ